MSAELINKEIIALLRRRVKDSSVFDLLSKIVGDPPNALTQLHFELCLELGLSSSQSINRCAAITLQNIAIHLADDIADEPLSELPQSLAQSVTAIFTLQQLVALLLAKEEQNFGEAFSALAKVGFGQHQEVSSTPGTLKQSKSLAEELNGEQFKAYALIAGAGSDANKNEQLAKIGYAFGVLTHIANDIKSGDQRFFACNEEGQASLRELAFDSFKTIQESDFSCYQRFSCELVEIVRR